MQGKRFSIRLRTALTVFTVTILVTSIWAVSHESVLHSFDNNGTDGVNPYAGLIIDATGNLYGTTAGGGIHSLGMVFKLSPREGGGWTETVLHSFGHGTDGAGPYANLVMDAAGNLYGTTQLGGIHGTGTVFELSPEQGGGWTELVLHSFNDNGSDGSYPLAGLIMDAAGNLYGMTQQGGIHSCGGKNCGTVFELSPRQGGGWTETVLHSFNNNGSDGANPQAGLTMDAAGNLYGTTYRGGIHSSGAVFELSPREGGGWTETVLHSFGNGTDGATPDSGLIVDAAGNLYGTTYFGGIHSDGTVFELSPREGGGWTETVLHSFGNGTDGMNPYAGLTIDATGNLYGTTVAGGLHSYGTAFELSPRQGGGWTETVLHSFGNGTDGINPYASLLLDANGNLYGTTIVGGIHTYGTAFEITP
ncbi:MAG: choice-of-anchor tandem repeat GloVer-containing protein [Candidatus Korobacteraceae bacterium]